MFVGREAELAKLESLYGQRSFQMAVVYGRRRVGKTTLINEFCRGKRTLSFTALEQSDADNLADFNRAIASFFNLVFFCCGGERVLFGRFGCFADNAQMPKFIVGNIVSCPEPLGIGAIHFPNAIDCDVFAKNLGNRSYQPSIVAGECACP